MLKQGDAIVRPSRVHARMSLRSAVPPLDPLAGAAALVTRVALAILLIGVPLSSVVTRQAVYAIVPVGAALTLVGWLMEPDMRGPRHLRNALLTPAGLGVLFLFGWTALSLLWTPFAVGPSERFVKTATTIGLLAVAVALLPERTKTSNLSLLPIGAMAGAITLIGAMLARWNPAVLPGEFTVTDRAALGLMLLFWPGVAGLLIRNKQAWAVALALVTAAAVGAVKSPIAMTALLASAFVYAAARRFGPPVARLLSIGWALVLLLAPLVCFLLSLVISSKPLPTLAGPVVVWGEIVAKDGIRTLIGHGFDAGARAVAAGYLPLETPRSFLFEIWFELGIVGVGAAAFVIDRLFRLASAAPAAISPLLVAGLVGALFVSASGVGVAPIWWVTFLALDAVAFTLVLRGQYKGRRPSVRDIARATGPS